MADDRVCVACAAQAHELEHLRKALESRDIIGQAKGVIMASMSCSADEAFEMLAAQSNTENRKLIEVATEIALRPQQRRARDVSRSTRPPCASKLVAS